MLKNNMAKITPSPSLVNLEVFYYNLIKEILYVNKKTLTYCNVSNI